MGEKRVLVGSVWSGFLMIQSPLEFFSAAVAPRILSRTPRKNDAHSEIGIHHTEFIECRTALRGQPSAAAGMTATRTVPNTTTVHATKV